MRLQLFRKKSHPFGVQAHGHIYHTFFLFSYAMLYLNIAPAIWLTYGFFQKGWDCCEDRLCCYGRTDG
ncbi:hypothetical protein BF29_1397 [Heyndrickxia coagulans DSM 1 = ATCC 7050]|uniref:Uncharacterized protein n=1 Tax=Heyndrickxia coagulans DSM 1 = ATCC 7050 TaxID=1121088 RepID=A0A8B4BUW9_HEYCO|nr:hypothetical protein BF29_1397 [Heyndrickxia coagulans DSM 1 = ATCC 7050]SHE90689.1 hypothetical protein SAMN02745208_01080 [Heyndrickxia coagulans DSM 1 = ATCC 7050]